MNGIGIVGRLLTEIATIEAHLRARAVSCGGDPDDAVERARQLVRTAGLRPRQAASKVIREICR